MSTLFRMSAFLAVVIAGCSRTVERPLNPSPAPPEGQAREWTNVTVEGPYGPLDMPVPALRISASQPLHIDSIALRQVERRLLARIARVARAQAASLVVDTVATMMSTRNPAPEIRAGLLGVIPFDEGEVAAAADGQPRLRAVAALAKELPGPIRIVANVSGTGTAIVNVGLVRARRIYLELVELAPLLADREVWISVKSTSVLPGAPLPRPVVEIYVSDR